MLAHVHIWNNAICLEILHDLHWDFTQHFFHEFFRAVAEFFVGNKLDDIPGLMAVERIGEQWLKVRIQLAHIREIGTADAYNHD